jgi:hypothetical protein
MGAERTLCVGQYRACPNKRGVFEQVSNTAIGPSVKIQTAQKHKGTSKFRKKPEHETVPNKLGLNRKR